MINQLCYTLIQMLSEPTVITSLIFLIIGLALSLLAKRITVSVRKTNEIKLDDKLMLGLRATGLVLMMIGLLLMIIGLI